MRYALAIALIASIALAQNDAEAQFRLARELEDLGITQRAGVEYLRYCQLFPKGEMAQVAKFRAGLAFEGESNNASRRIYEELINNSEDIEVANKSIYRLSLIDFKNAHTERSIATIEKYYTQVDENSRNSLVYLKGWNYFWLRDYNLARGTFLEAGGKNIEDAGLFMAEMSELGESLPQRSPFLAASMSAIVPGAGRAYLGNWGDAVTSLIVVSGSLAGGYLLWDEDRGFSFGLAISGAIFYIGNVYGSFAGAKYYNEQQHRNLYNYAKDNTPRRPEELFRD